MNLQQHFFINNECYKSGKTIAPKGIMVHSLGVAQPDVNVFLRTWNTPSLTPAKCVHAFVSTEGVYQTLPWNMRGWHAGGAANNTHIGFEICEPAGHTYDGGTMIGYDAEKNAEYFKSVWNNAVELCAMLCKQYNLDPLKDIICHSEGYKMGIATNHADVMHWFPKHGESMDSFRQAVKERLEEDRTQDVTVNVGGVEVPAKLIDDKTYVELRPLIEAVKQKLTVTWSQENGAGVKL